MIRKTFLWDYYKSCEFNLYTDFSLLCWSAFEHFWFIKRFPTNCLFSSLSLSLPLSLSLTMCVCRLSVIPYLADSAGAGEYTNSISAEGEDPPITSVLDITLKNLMVGFRKCEVPLHCHYSQVLFDAEW